MAISAKCAGCGKRLSGPDSAAGRKVKCPRCGQVVQFPRAGTAPGPSETAGAARPPKRSPADLAQALSGKPAPAEAEEEPATREGEAPKETPPAEAPVSPSPAVPSGPTPSRRSSTTMSRMLARSSPYKTLRLLGVIIFVAGVAVGALVFIGGLVGLIMGVSTGVLPPAAGVVVFVGGLVAAGVVLLVAKATGELIRLWADVGDRARHVTQMLEETIAQQGGEDLGGGDSR